MRTLAIIALAGLLAGMPGRAAPQDAAPAPRLDLYGDPLYAGADVRLGTVRLRHQGSGWQMGVGFSPDGETLISAAEDGAVRYWEAASGKPVRAVETGQGNLRGFAFSADRALAATLGSQLDREQLEFVRTVKVWDARDGSEATAISWTQPRGEAFAVAFTPDNRTIITGSTDGTLRFWDRASGEALLEYKLATPEIRALDVSPDGALLAAAGSDSVWLWKWHGGDEPAKLEEAGRHAPSLAFSPDGSLLAIGADGGGGVQLWDVPEARLLRTLPAAERMYAKAVAFSPDGSRVAAADYRSKTVVLWDTATSERLPTIDTAPDSANCLSFSPDGRRLAAGLSAGVMRLWDLTTNEELAAYPEAHRFSATTVVFTPQGAAVTASDDGSVCVWDASTGRQQRRMEHDYWTRGLAVSPDGRLIASSSLDNTVRIWNAETGEQVHRLAGHGRVGGKRALAFTPDAQRLVSWGDDMHLRVWSVESGESLHDHRLRPSGIEIPEEDRPGADEWRFSLEHCVMSPDASHFVLGYARTIYVFETATGAELRKFSTELRAADFDVSPDGRFLLVSGYGRGTETRLAGGSTLFSSGENHALKLLDFATGEELWTHELPEGGAGPVCFSPDGQRMAAAMRDPQNQIRVWDVASRREVLAIKNVPAIGWQRSLAISRDGRKLACGLQDATVLIWNLQP